MKNEWNIFQLKQKKAFLVFCTHIGEIEKASCSASRIVCVEDSFIPKPCLWTDVVRENCVCNFDFVLFVYTLNEQRPHAR